MPEYTDIEQARSKLQREGMYLVPDWKAETYFTDKDSDGIEDALEKRVELDKKVLGQYRAALHPSKGIWTRLRAFLGASTDVGRGAKAIKDFALLFVPYGKNISSVTEFVTERFIKPKNTTVMQDKKPWYKSVTVNSIIVIVVLGAGQFFGVELTESGLQDTVEAVGFAIASLTALWGRVRAQTKIGSK